MTVRNNPPSLYVTYHGHGTVSIPIILRSAMSNDDNPSPGETGQDEKEVFWVIPTIPEPDTPW
ncbi:MAG: hypothetical protein ACTSVD_09180 [Candidatus Thorarchaeota archaeon]|nr:MAG: hypothetical protein DRO93_09535 [Candidatus Thorarchaeota archaeon]